MDSSGLVHNEDSSEPDGSSGPVHIEDSSEPDLPRHNAMCNVSIVFKIGGIVAGSSSLDWVEISSIVGFLYIVGCRSIVSCLSLVDCLRFTFGDLLASTPVACSICGL